jgi:GTP cyclohydrolase I
VIDLTYNDLSYLVQCGFHAVSILENPTIYGVPNGGIYAALLVAKEIPKVKITEIHNEADVIVDDIVDSGKTREYWWNLTGKPFYAIVDKTEQDKQWANEWITFPWERARREDGPQDAVRRILQYIGEDVNREGLKETPDRVVKSYSELFSGYKQNPADIMKVFEDGACDEMVILKEIEWYSTCEHHLQPFFGKAHIAYIPNGKIIGISKLARLLDIYARRLQVQERLTTQVTKALDKYLEPRGSACVLEAVHFCMVCRGVQKQHSKMITSSLTGVFRQPEVRAEFFNLIGK